MVKKVISCLIKTRRNLGGELAEKIVQIKVDKVGEEQTRSPGSILQKALIKRRPP